ncbi:hypothetical protein SAMD00023353_0700180 [Rosellinia necatrix]|uniref:Uncharacterized protein n=1 Tax=Rosellinia necatrix TaxID=77044 RepID=A0A1S7ULM6_ROSNE|nr:hypothetical protein SAMD00023353_0700180 [Rosellinia necatrix]
MRLGFSESQKETAGKNNCGPRRSAIAPSVVGDEIEQTRQSRQYANIWDEPGPTEPGAQDSAHKPMPRSAIRRSVVGSVSGEGGNRDSWPKSRPLRNSLLGSRPGSRLSSRLRVGDDNLHDTLDGWIELEEVDTRVSAEEATPEPDNVDVRSGIFVATQINQEVHRVREPDQRPRIITIPQRAKVNQSPV